MLIDIDHKDFFIQEEEAKYYVGIANKEQRYEVTFNFVPDTEIDLGCIRLFTVSCGRDNPHSVVLVEFYNKAISAVINNGQIAVKAPIDAMYEHSLVSFYQNVINKNIPQPIASKLKLALMKLVKTRKEHLGSAHFKIIT